MKTRYEVVFKNESGVVFDGDPSRTFTNKKNANRLAKVLNQIQEESEEEIKLKYYVIKHC